MASIGEMGGRAKADMLPPMNQQALSSLIWSVADLLRGDFKQSEYGRVILPFTVLRRLDCVLAPTKAEVLKEYAAKQAAGIAFEPFVKRKTGLDFYNVSSLDMGKLMGDQDNIRANLDSYIQGFSPDVRSIFEHFDFAAHGRAPAQGQAAVPGHREVRRLRSAPERVDNMQMGLVFEELIRKFAEISQRDRRRALHAARGDPPDGESAVHRGQRGPDQAGHGAHHVRPDRRHRRHALGGWRVPAELNPKARLTLFGQELNAESHAICKADMLIRGQDISNIVLGNTLSDDGLFGKLFDYMLSNPPFGVEWKKIEKAIREEHEKQGYSGRFGPGLPRVSDGSLLFLLHLLSKMRPAAQGGSRIGIVLNGSPLFTGGAGSRRVRDPPATCWRTIWSRRSSRCPPTCSTTPASATYIWMHHQPQARRSQGLRAADRRLQLLAEDAQEPGLQAQGDERRTHRPGDAPVRRFHRSQPGDRDSTPTARRSAARC